MYGRKIVFCRCHLVVRSLKPREKKTPTKYRRLSFRRVKNTQRHWFDNHLDQLIRVFLSSSIRNDVMHLVGALPVLFVVVIAIYAPLRFDPGKGGNHIRDPPNE